MNDAAMQHCQTAKEFIAKGNEFYRQAADEIALARAAGATLNECADAIGYSPSWCKAIAQWAKIPAQDGQPDVPVDWKRGSHATVQEVREGVKRLAATDPSIVTEILDTMPEEQREMVAQEIAQREDFAAAVKSNEVVRDTLILGVLGTEEEQQEKRDEAHRGLITKHPMFGWREVADGFGEANRGLDHAITALVKLAINAQVDPQDDILALAHHRAEKLGEQIHELEMAWGETPISDAIEERRASQV